MKRQDDSSSPVSPCPTRELDELRARVAALEVELEARDAFIIAAAHELRNPISPLMLHVQRLGGVAKKAQAGAPEGQDGSVSATWLNDQLDLLGRRLTRFLSALNRILDVSSIQSGRIQLVIDEVDLAEVTRDVVSGFERELAASQSELTLEADETLPGRLDRMRFEQIVSNLVSNAIRYGDSKPIHVSVRQVGEQAELVVEDQGVGIAEADQARIFERYERAHLRYRSGFGVGLWMVKQLADAMNGAVQLQSSAGGGSTFRVTLPTNRNGSGDDR